MAWYTITHRNDKAAPYKAVSRSLCGVAISSCFGTWDDESRNGARSRSEDHAKQRSFLGDEFDDRYDDDVFWRWRNAVG